MTSNRPFELYDSESLRTKVYMAMDEQLITRLADLVSFDGAGIYALYYTGEFLPYDVYQPLAALNRQGRIQVPIYVGKAEPPGGRKGRAIAGGTKQPLYSRLREHLGSIMKATTTLSVRDFYYRYLIVDNRSIRTCETLLIERTEPLWNVYVDGFGNHAPGKGRGVGRRPHWDTIHPGRSWAEDLPPNTLSSEDIRRNIRLALAGHAAIKISSDAQIAEANTDEV